MATDRISVRIDSGLRRRLEEESSIRGKREAELVREALEKYLRGREDRESCYDLAERMGVLGSLKDAPADLSTNRKHFKGFGRK